MLEVGWASRPGLTGPGPVRSPLRSRGSSGDYALCPFHLHDFDDGILASKMEVLRANFGLLRFNPQGCSYVELRSLSPLEVISSSS
jgi:hypothetical protein